MTALRAAKSLRCPYVGPVAFTRETRHLFFGRSRDVARLLDLVIAERIVVLHSPSGAGKSSIIEAGVVPKLKEDGFSPLPTARLGHELRPATESVQPRNRYVFSALLSWEEAKPDSERMPLAQLAELTLAEYLDAHSPATHDSDLLLVLDQFEEVFTSASTDVNVKGDFFRQLGETLRNRRRWAIIAVREEFLGNLDTYARLVPTAFSKRYRLEMLGEDEAVRAVVRPAEAVGASFAEDAAHALVRDLATTNAADFDGRVRKVVGPTVEPVQLQVVCLRVWEERAHPAQVTESDVRHAGSVDRALQAHYEAAVEAMAAEGGVTEHQVRDWFDEELIAAQGWRAPVLRGPAEGEADERILRIGMERHILRAEKRRGTNWYELTHDRLVEPIRASNREWRDSVLAPLQRQAAEWVRQGHHRDLLLTGNSLVEAQDWLATEQPELSATEQRFVEESSQAETLRAQQRDAQEVRRRYQKRVIWVLAVALCLSLLLVGSVYRQGRLLAAEKAKATAFAESLELTQRDKVVSSLATGSSLELEQDVDRGLLLARESARAEDTLASDGAGGDEAGMWDAYGALTSAIQQTPVSSVLRGSGTDLGQAVVSGVAYSPAGNLIVTHNPDQGALRLWSAAGEPVCDLGLPEGGLRNPRNLEFAPDGSRLAAVAGTGEVLVWTLPETSTDVALGTDLCTQAKFTTLESPHPRGIPSWRIAFSPKGTQIASVGSTGLVVLDVGATDPSRARIPSFKLGPSGAVNGWDVAWTRGGTTLAVGEVDGTISEWNATTGERPDVDDPSQVLQASDSPHAGESEVFRIEAFRDGEQYVAASRNLVSLRNPARNRTEAQLVRTGVRDIAVHAPEGGPVHLAVADAQDVVTIYRVKDAGFVRLREVRASGSGVRALSFDPYDHGRLIVSGVGKLGSLWDVPVADGVAVDMVLRPNADTYRTVAAAGTSFTWAETTLESGRPSVVLGGTGVGAIQRDGAQSVSGDGRVYVVVTAAEEDEAVQVDLYDASTPDARPRSARVNGPISPRRDDQVTAVALDHSGDLVAVCCRASEEGEQVILLEASGESLSEIDDQVTAAGYVDAFAIGGDAASGHVLYLSTYAPPDDEESADYEPGVGKWVRPPGGGWARTASFEHPRIGSGGGDSVSWRSPSAMAASPSGHLVVGYQDGTTLTWLPDSKVLSFEHSSAVTDIAFAEGSGRFVTSSLDRTLVLWEPTVGALSRTRLSEAAQHVLVAEQSSRATVAMVGNDGVPRLMHLMDDPDDLAAFADTAAALSTRPERTLFQHECNRYLDENERKLYASEGTDCGTDDR